MKETENGIVQNLVGLADKSPVLITNEASLQELNTRLDDKIPMDRFRPNIIFTGKNAYEEDSWETIKIGDKVSYIYKGNLWWEGYKSQILHSDNKELNDFVFDTELTKRLKEK